jgi:hypothetical protein
VPRALHYSQAHHEQGRWWVGQAGPVAVDLPQAGLCIRVLTPAKRSPKHAAFGMGEETTSPGGARPGGVVWHYQSWGTNMKNRCPY